MGNYLGSSLISRLRRSGQGTTVVSQTSANPPIFSDPTTLPGVARAWVKFSGLHTTNQICTIFNKSTNVEGVTSQGVGDYKIGFVPRLSAFTDSNYIVVGSISSSDRNNPISAANSFFVMEPGYRFGVRLTKDEFRIQTIYSTASAGAVYEGPAYASVVSLVIFK